MANKFIQTLLGEPEGYVSEADQFLAQLRQNNANKLSASQKEQIAYMKDIAQKRDSHVETEVNTDLWRNF
jgi:hypothetical protein